MYIHSHKNISIYVKYGVRLCAVRSMQYAVCGVRLSGIQIHAVCGSARGSVQQCTWQCAAVRQCVAVHTDVYSRVCMGVAVHVAVRTDVCGSARVWAIVHVAVCGSACGSVWQYMW
jgi:hypothetical protein